jgi:hypothetical protein
MYSSTHSLASALDGGEWSASRPGRFTPRERAPGTHWIGGWVGPRAVLDAVVKRKIPSPPPRNRTPKPTFNSYLPFTCYRPPTVMTTNLRTSERKNENSVGGGMSHTCKAVHSLCMYKYSVSRTFLEELFPERYRYFHNPLLNPPPPPSIQDH